MSSSYSGIHLLYLIIPILVVRFLIGGGSLKYGLFAFYLKAFLWTYHQQNRWLQWMFLTILALWSSKSILSSGHSIKSETQNGKPRLRPLIFPCKTTHTRFFPKKHSFGYSYLLVGIPVGWKGTIKGVLGAEEVSQRKSWFSVRAEDYLARGQEQLDLQGKLKAYLSSQGEDLNKYAHAYFVTAPRFQGYSFNPVSFWYLFSEDIKLQAMVLEVNNTFDERRMYFMKRGVDLEMDNTGEESKFSHTWTKDFHVSPFNSRKGDYAMAAVNLFTQELAPRIDNVITLKSSKGHTKLVARIFSTGDAIDPANLTSGALFRLLTGWFWVGYMTYPRILKEAFKLFFQRRLHVWFRPEVIQTSIGRRQSERESIIAMEFASFLQHRVSKSSTISSLEYTPPNGTHLDTITFRPVPGLEIIEDEHLQALGLHILTPQFYTGIASQRPDTYIKSSETQELSARTFTTSSCNLLAALLRPDSADIKLATKRYPDPGILLRQTIYKAISFNGPSNTALDDHVMTHSSPERQKVYTQAIFAVRFAGKFLGGIDGLLDTARVTLEMMFAWKMTELGIPWIIQACSTRGIKGGVIDTFLG